MTKKFVTETIIKKIQAHIATQIFVIRTISYKILLHLATKYFVTKNIFYFYFFMALILTCNLSLHY